VSRLGGDEFVLFLRKHLHKEVVRIAERLRQDVEACEFSFGWRLTTSIGIAIRPETKSLRTSDELIKAPDELIKAANDAMRQAKDGGGNRVIAGAA